MLLRLSPPPQAIILVVDVAVAGRRVSEINLLASRTSPLATRIVVTLFEDAIGFLGFLLPPIR